MLLSMMWLSGCQTTSGLSNLPKFPHPPAEVGRELTPRCFPRMADKNEVLNLCPATKDWLAKLMKYEEQTKVK